MPPVFSRCCRTQQHREKVGTREKIFGRGGLKNRDVFPEAYRDHEQGRAAAEPCAIVFTASPRTNIFSHGHAGINYQRFNKKTGRGLARPELGRLQRLGEGACIFECGFANTREYYFIVDGARLVDL